MLGSRLRFQSICTTHRCLVMKPPWLISPSRIIGLSAVNNNSLRLFSSSRYLEDLERQANRKPKDSYAQLRFLNELNKNHPEIVIERVESGYFASNESVQKEFVKALVATNRLDTYPITIQTGTNPSYEYKPSQDYNQSPFQELSASSEAIKVEIVEGSFRTQGLKFLRFIMTLMLLYMIIGYFSEDLSLSKRASIFKEVKPETGSKKTFADVKGAEEAKQELEEIVEYLTNPHKFTRLGGKLPKGVLLTGPPGTGKTLLAKAIAGEANVPFFYSSASEFEEMFVGVGAKRVRELFDAARKNAPCIVFIDEIDAIGSTRHLKEQQALKMTLNQLLVELDGFKESSGVIIIGATNFPEVLDPALVRAGRFDRNIVVPLPDVRARKAILEHYLQVIPRSNNIDSMRLARGCPGLSGADLANLVNIAAIRASTQNRAVLEFEDLEFAKDKILMGGQRFSAVIPDIVRKVTAWHESGHALVAFFTNGSMPLHKATVLPRGPALGMVVQLPEEKDLLQRTKKQMLAEIDVCLGGRVAEEIIFGEDEITSGARSDIEKATKLARSMVKHYGMSDKVGLVFYNEDDKNKMLDEEVRKIISDSYTRVKKLLTKKKRQLGYLANNLLEYETLTSEEIEHVIAGKDLSHLRKQKEALEKRQKVSSAPENKSKTILFTENVDR